jgi:septal ring-binding cell division protein DamX
MQNNASVVSAEARVHIPETSITVSSKAPVIETPAIQRATVNSSPDNSRVNTKAEITNASVKIGDAHEQHKSVIKKEEIPVASAHKKPLSTRHTYSVQLGFFSEAPNAKTLTQKAKLKGLAEIRTETELRDGKSHYRVLIGSFSTLTEAQTLLGKVHSLGFKAAVHRQ